MTALIRNRKGFSLTEILITTFVIILTLTIAVQIFVALNKNYKILIEYLSSYLKGREMIDIISKDCRIAVRIMDSYGVYTTTDDTLVLKVPSVDSNGDIIDVDNDFDYIIYRTEENDLYKIVIPGSNSARPAMNEIIKEAVGPLYMAYNGTSLSSIAHKSTLPHVSIWLSVSYVVDSKIHTITPGTTVKLMNYEWEFVR